MKINRKIKEFGVFEWYVIGVAGTTLMATFGYTIMGVLQ